MRDKKIEKNQKYVLQYNSAKCFFILCCSSLLQKKQGHQVMTKRAIMKKQGSNNETEFEFQQWMELAQKDSEKFEKQRLELIESVINGAPERLRKRLSGLQWSIDAKLKTSKNPMDGCMKIYQMMMNSVYEPGGFLSALNMEENVKQNNRQKDIQNNVISNVFEIKDD